MRATFVYRVRTSKGAITEAEVRNFLVSEGHLDPKGRFLTQEVDADKLPELTREVILELRRRMELQEDDELEVCIMGQERVRAIPITPKTLLAALLLNAVGRRPGSPVNCDDYPGCAGCPVKAILHRLEAGCGNPDCPTCGTKARARGAAT